MRKIYKLIVSVVTLGVVLGGCSDFLDSDYLFKDRLSIEDVFKSEDYSQEWLAGTYRFLGDGVLAQVSSKGHNPFGFADDMYFGDRRNAYRIFKNGEYTENGLGDIGDVGGRTWSACYKGIRQATIGINNIDINEEMTQTEIKDFKGQSHFLRAYYYWALLRLFGPIPLVSENGIDYIEDYDKIAQPRNSYQECVEYIDKELLLAAKDLLPRDLLNIARPTPGAALALRARLWLYAASPLMNGKGGEYVSEIQDDLGNPLMPLTYDEEKWAKAAAAAKDVMELGVYELYTAPFKVEEGTAAFPGSITPPHNSEFSDYNWPDGWKNIDPFESYRSLFNGAVGANDNQELIFTRGQNQSNEGLDVMVVHQLPRDATGWNTHGLTLKQSDSYYMNDGQDAPGKDSEIGRGDGSQRVSGYVSEQDVADGLYKPLSKDVSLQFANREPRFYASVAYNGSVWNLRNAPEERDREKQIFYYRGAGNGYTNTMFWLRTGIGIKKFVHPDDTHQGSSMGLIRRKIEPVIRYAEILLIYAEALNELEQSFDIPSWNGNKTHTVKREVEDIKEAIRPIRIRAGVPDYTSATYREPDELRKAIKRERQIELMGEGHRYFDLRRWMDAPVEESMPIYGYNALATKDMRDIFHRPVAVPSLPTTFSKKMWFWPITHQELRRNKRLTQNPGWTYSD